MSDWKLEALPIGSAEASVTPGNDGRPDGEGARMASGGLIKQRTRRRDRRTGRIGDQGLRLTHERLGVGRQGGCLTGAR